MLQTTGWMSSGAGSGYVTKSQSKNNTLSRKRKKEEIESPEQAKSKRVNYSGSSNNGNKNTGRNGDSAPKNVATGGAASPIGNLEALKQRVKPEYQRLVQQKKQRRTMDAKAAWSKNSSDTAGMNFWTGIFFRLW